jgi:hypothetical protein
MDRDVHLFARLHRLGILMAAAVFAIVLAASIGTAGGAKTIVLGAAAPATPACPDSCQAIGKTTGFQTQIGKAQNPFVSPVTGRVVAWSIKLSRPSDKQIQFFREFFGAAPQARLSVLKPINKQIKLGRPMYKLKSQGPVEELEPFLGSTTTFALQQPLIVREGQVVALTVPTWAPAFAVNLGGKNSWRASRKKTKCQEEADIKAGTAHQTPGQERIYGCLYKTARLLYSATVVPDPNAVPPKKKKPTT